MRKNDSQVANLFYAFGIYEPKSFSYFGEIDTWYFSKKTNLVTVAKSRVRDPYEASSRSRTLG